MGLYNKRNNLSTEFMPAQSFYNMEVYVHMQIFYRSGGDMIISANLQTQFSKNVEIGPKTASHFQKH